MTDETIALLALCYEEALEGSSVEFPRRHGDEIYEDMKAEHPISLLTMFASAALTDFDWALIGAHADEDVTLCGLMLEAEPERVEAFLHAMQATGRRDGLPLPVELALRALKRWDDVEEAMDLWRSLGIAGTRYDVEELYIDAMSLATGRTRNDVLEDFLDAMPERA